MRKQGDTKHQARAKSFTGGSPIANLEGKKVSFSCEIEGNDKEDIMSGLLRIVCQLRDGYTSGLNWNSNIDTK